MTSVTSINNYLGVTVKQRKKCKVPFPHRAAPYEEFFSCGSRHHCRMEVGAYVWFLRVALSSREWTSVVGAELAVQSQQRRTTVHDTHLVLEQVGLELALQ